MMCDVNGTKRRRRPVKGDDAADDDVLFSFTEISNERIHYIIFICISFGFFFLFQKNECKFYTINTRTRARHILLLLLERRRRRKRKKFQYSSHTIFFGVNSKCKSSSKFNSISGPLSLLFFYFTFTKVKFYDEVIVISDSTTHTTLSTTLSSSSQRTSRRTEHHHHQHHCILMNITSKISFTIFL